MNIYAFVLYCTIFMEAVNFGEWLHCIREYLWKLLDSSNLRSTSNVVSMNIDAFVLYCRICMETVPKLSNLKLVKINAC